MWATFALFFRSAEEALWMMSAFIIFASDLHRSETPARDLLFDRGRIINVFTTALRIKASSTREKSSRRSWQDEV